MPVGQTLQLSILNDYCGTAPIYQQSLTAITQNTDIGNVIITPGNNSLGLVAGTVKNCSNAIVTSGTVQLYADQKYYNTSILPNGSFSILLPTCAGSTIQLYANDAAVGQQGPTKTLTVGTDVLNPVQLSACGSSTTINNTLFIGGDDSTLYALNATTGAVKWSYKIDGAITVTPVIDNNTVVVGAQASTQYKLYALDASTGTLKWRSNQQPGGVSSNGATANGILYMGMGYYIVATNMNTGAIVWQKLMNPFGPVVESAPTVVNNVVYFGNDSSIYAFNAATGSQIWATNMHNEPYYSGPAVFNGSVYVGSLQTEKFIALDAVSGAVKWSIPAGCNGFVSPTCANGKVYTVGYRTIYSFDTSTHAIQWQFPVVDDVLSSPCIANNRVYFGCSDFNFYAIDATTGLQVWKTNIGDATLASAVAADGMVYTVGQLGEKVYAINASTGAVVWTKSIGPAILAGGLKSSPCLVDQSGVIHNAAVSGNQQ